MPNRNDVVPLSPSATDNVAGPEVEAVAATHKQQQAAQPAAAKRNSATLTKSDAPNKLATNTPLNIEMATKQERRARLVLLQRRDTAFQLVYALFGLALMVVQTEYLWFANTRHLTLPCHVDNSTSPACPRCLESMKVSVPQQDGQMILHSVRVLLSVSTLLLLYHTYRFYASEVEVMKIKNIVPPKATLLSSSLRRRLVLELALLAVHPFPGLESVDPRWPNLLVASSLLMFVRIGLALRVVQFRHPFNSSNGWFIGALTNVDFTVAFFLKSTLKNYPSRCILAAFVVLVGVGSYALFVVERFLCAFVHGACCQPMSLADALWTLVITILTVGYGDVVPRTIPGRALAVSAGLFGMLCTAATIAVMSHYLVLTRSEHKVNAFLKKDENRQLINDHAARSIQAFVQLRAIQRQSLPSQPNSRAQLTVTRLGSSSNMTAVSRGEKQSPATAARELGKAEIKLFDVLRAYRQVKRHVNSQDVSDPMDKQMTMLEMMEVNVEYIRTKIEDLAELFSRANRQVASPEKRRLSHFISAVMNSSSSSSSIATTTAAPPPTSSASHHHTPTRLPFQPDHRAAPTTSTIHEGDEGREQPSQPPPRLSGAYLHHLPAHDHLPSGPSAMATVGTHQNGFHQTDGGIPEWAILLESSLQTILGQVAEVAAEVDAVKSRVYQHMDAVDAKLLDLERKLVVGDALREIVRPKPGRPSFRRESSESNFSAALDTAAGGANGGGGQGSGMALMSSNGSTTSNTSLPRFRRVPSSSSNRNPTIQKFVTQRDLEEFHGNDGMNR